MGIFWFTAWQPAKGTQTGYGAMPSMPHKGEAGCKECTLTNFPDDFKNFLNRDREYKAQEGRSVPFPIASNMIQVGLKRRREIFWLFTLAGNVPGFISGLYPAPGEDP